MRSIASAIRPRRRRAPTGGSEAAPAVAASSSLSAPRATEQVAVVTSDPGLPADDALLKRVSSLPGSLSILRAHLTNPEFHMAPQYTRRQAVVLAANEPDDTWAYGVGLLAVTAAVWVAAVYALVVSKVMPHTGVWVLDAVKDDRYYCLLVPVTALSFVIAVFCNWLGMKYFRHN